MGGNAPVRQSDRLVEFTGEAGARRASSGKERYNAFASYPMALPSMRPFLVVGQDRSRALAVGQHGEEKNS